MLQKIKDFFKRSQEGSSSLTYVEQQIDTGTAIVEMLEHAKHIEAEVVVTIQVGPRKEVMVMQGAGSESTEQLYQIVSKSRAYWFDLWRQDLDARQKRSAERTWKLVAKKMGGDAYPGPDEDESGKAGN